MAKKEGGLPMVRMTTNRGTLEIELLNDRMWLESRSDTALIGGANLALVGGELIQFGRVEAIAPKRNVSLTRTTITSYRCDRVVVAKARRFRIVCVTSAREPASLTASRLHLISVRVA